MKKCSNYFIVLLISLLTTSVFAQENSTISSLISSFQKIPNDTNKLNRLSFLVDSLPDGIWQHVNTYYEQVAKQLSKNSNPVIRKKSLQSYAESLSNEGVHYAYTGDYERALELFSKSEKISLEIHENYSLGMAIQNIAAIYDREGEFEKALYNYKKALPYTIASHNATAHVVTLSNIGVVYQKRKEYDSCFYYAQKAYDLVSKNNFSYHESGGIITRLGNAYENKENFRMAMHYFQEGLQISLKNEDKNGTCESYVQVARTWEKQGDTKKAISFALKSLKTAQEYNMLFNIKNAASLLKELHKKEKHYQEAYNMIELEVASLDSLNKIENKRAVIRDQVKREYDVKEATKKLEQEKRDVIASKELQKQKLIRNGFIGGFAFLLVFAGVVFAQRNKIKNGKKRSDELLLNILPAEVTNELKERGQTTAKHFEEVSVMFTDFVEFTKIGEKLSPQVLVQELHECFSAFDAIIERNGLEKIKTVGDAYIAVCGLPVTNEQHATKTVQAAKEILHFMEERKRQEKIFEIRIGIHTGPVVAGIVGVKKFAYDIWGDTVNTASRMESSGEAGKINISETTYALIKDKFSCTHRGKIAAKGKGEVDMYFVNNNCNS